MIWLSGTLSGVMPRDKAIEAADIARRESVERARIVAELKLEEERIASQQTREVIDIERKRHVEAAEETRVVELAPAKVLQGAVRLQGLTSSPTPDTHVRVAWA